MMKWRGTSAGVCYGSHHLYKRHNRGERTGNKYPDAADRNLKKKQGRMAVGCEYLTVMLSLLDKSDEIISQSECSMINLD